MSVVPNRARQLLLLRDALSRYSGQPMANAIQTLASEGGETTRLHSRLTYMVINLPNEMALQSRQVLGQTISTYSQHIDRVIDHFKGQAFSIPVDQWFRVFDPAAEMAINAIADLLDIRLSSVTADPEKVGDLKVTVTDLIDEINSDETLDEDTKNYLLEVALHLLQILQRVDLFGAEGIVELQGQFISSLLNFQPGLILDAGDAAESSGRRFADRIWQATVAATVLTGLPANAFAIADVVQHALHR